MDEKKFAGRTQPVISFIAPNGVNPTPASPTTEYAYRLGEMLIQADASDCKWLVSDHLGSPRIIIGKSGSLVDTKRRDFIPFGEDLGAGQFGRTTALGYEPAGAPSNPREKFATYERDDETGLDFAQARYYQNRLGRFTSVDPLMASAAPIEPQSWNRYGYVGNRPLVVTDPTGMVWGSLIKNGQTQYIWYENDEVLKKAGATALRANAADNGFIYESEYGDHIRLNLSKNSWDVFNNSIQAFYNTHGPTGQSEFDSIEDSLNLATTILDATQVMRNFFAKAAAKQAVREATEEGIETVQDILKNPNLLQGKTPLEVQRILGETPGWRVEALGQGSHKGQGWVLREYTTEGNATGRMVRWRPGGGHHGSAPYWRVTSPENGKSGIIPAGGQTGGQP